MTGSNSPAGSAPLVVSLPHTGTEIPADDRSRASCVAVARRKDTDWHVERLYDFAAALGATVLRTRHLPHGHRREPRPVRRVALPRPGDDRAVPDDHVRRRTALPAPAAATDPGGDRPAAGRPASTRTTPALADEIARLRAAARAGRRVRLPLDPLGHPACSTACPPHITAGELRPAADGRGRGCGRRDRPDAGDERPVPRRVHHPAPRPAGRRRPRDPDGTRHRGYLAEPVGPVDETNWPPAYDRIAAPMRVTLRRVLEACLAFAGPPRGAGLTTPDGEVPPAACGAGEGAGGPLAGRICGLRGRWLRTDGSAATSHGRGASDDEGCDLAPPRTAP